MRTQQRSASWAPATWARSHLGEGQRRACQQSNPGNAHQHVTGALLLSGLLLLAGLHPLSSPVDVRKVAHKLGSLRTSPTSDGQLSPPPLSDDELEGAQRLRPDPDSPTSRLLEAAARRTLAASQHNTPEKTKFSYISDIMRNPGPAKAARAELGRALSEAGRGPEVTGGHPVEALQFEASISHIICVAAVRVGFGNQVLGAGYSWA